MKYAQTTFVVEGQQFGWLTVINETERKTLPSGRKERMVKCRCVCGKEVVVFLNNLVRRPNTSCGCKGEYGNNFYEHGLSRHPIHLRWQGMIARCYTKSHPFYHDYGGRGIKVCEEWKNDFMSFYNWAINNGYDANLELDRFPDNNGDYEPNNCRWATRIMNANNMRSNKKYLYNGEMLTLPEIARKENISYKNLYARVCGPDRDKIGVSEAVYLGKNGIMKKKANLPESKRTICSNHNIPYNKVMSRMYYRGIPFIESLNYFL